MIHNVVRRRYDPTRPNDFAAMDIAEVAAEKPAIVAEMHRELVAML